LKGETTMNICTCATHCPQSPHHTYACCRSQECDCWCHKIINPHHKTIVAQATGKQMEAAERAYVEHCRICAGVGIEPENFGRFIAEWIECAGAEAQADAQALGLSPAPAQALGSNDDCHHRSYERMFDGQKGWE